MNTEDITPWNTPDYINWSIPTEYPSETNPFHYDHELATNEK